MILKPIYKYTHSQFQKAIVQFAAFHRLPVYHGPNEGKRSKINGQRLKDEGMIPGWPDLHFIRANKEYHGLYMELKIYPDKVTQNQLACIMMLRIEGNHADVYYDLDIALDVIRAFYGIRKD
jgi:hypothetical protein